MKSIFTDDYKKTIGHLKKARTDHGFSQKDIAEKLGVTQSYISKIEQGQLRLDISQLKAFAKALGIRIEDLLK
jgi:transcriptional regulator with XRE-family HTH domain